MVFKQTFNKSDRGGVAIRSSDITYRNILAKSAEIFALKGYEKASMREISSAAGVSLAAPYYYFKNKETILFEIQKKGFEYLVESLKSVVIVINHRGKSCMFLWKTTCGIF